MAHIGVLADLRPQQRNEKSAILNGPVRRGFAGRWYAQLVERLHVGLLPRHGPACAGTSHPQPRTAQGSLRIIPEEKLGPLASAQPEVQRIASGEAELESRISSYELAAVVQDSAREPFYQSQEPAYIRALYGLDKNETRSYATRCSIARWLVERGVRFVQLFLNGQP